MNGDYPISARLKMISNAYERVLTQHMQTMELTSAQAHIIGFLMKNGGAAVCQRDIEEVFGLKHPTVTGLLARMEEKGFVTLQSGEADKRCKRIELTQKSVDSFLESRRLIRETDQELFGDLPPEELAALSATVDKVIANAKRSHLLPCRGACK